MVTRKGTRKAPGAAGTNGPAGPLPALGHHYQARRVGNCARGGRSSSLMKRQPRNGRYHFLCRSQRKSNLLREIGAERLYPFC